jgi:hypothetical protein
MASLLPPLSSLQQLAPIGPEGFCRGDFLKHDIQEAMEKSRLWISRPGNPNPLVQELKKRNASEETGWLRAIEFGLDRVGRHNNDEEREYIHALYSSISRDFTYRKEFLKELSYAWKFTTQHLEPLLDTVEEKSRDERAMAELETIYELCSNWNPYIPGSTHPFLDYAKKNTDERGDGWLRAAIVGRHRSGQRLSKDDWRSISTLYSQSNSQSHIADQLHDEWIGVVSSAWDASERSIKTALNKVPPVFQEPAEPRAIKSDPPPKMLSVDTQETTHPCIVTPANAEHPRVVTPANAECPPPIENANCHIPVVTPLHEEQEQMEQLFPQDDEECEEEPLTFGKEDLVYLESMQDDEDELSTFATTEYDKLVDIRKNEQGLYEYNKCEQNCDLYSIAEAMQSIYFQFSSLEREEMRECPFSLSCLVLQVFGHF